VIIFIILAKFVVELLLVLKVVDCTSKLGGTSFALNRGVVSQPGLLVAIADSMLEDIIRSNMLTGFEIVLWELEYKILEIRLHSKIYTIPLFMSNLWIDIEFGLKSLISLSAENVLSQLEEGEENIVMSALPNLFKSKI
jgi:hypothetical protein